MLRRRRQGLAIAGSAAAHLLLLAVLAQYMPRLDPPAAEPSLATEVIQVWLVPPPTRTLASRQAPAGVGRRGPSPRAPAKDDAAAPSPVVIGEPDGQAGAPDLPDGVRAALRRRLGCGERSGLRLAADERGDCDERLGRGALAAPYLHAPIAPEIRQYWDAVAKAKAPDGAPTPNKARGRLGMFEPEPVGMKGHGPGVGCHIGFGRGGFTVHHPPHGLKLGPLPCFLVPPAGSLSPDVDVQNPDAVVLGRKAP